MVQGGWGLGFKCQGGFVVWGFRVPGFVTDGFGLNF